MDEVEFHAPPRESKSKRWLSFHPFSGKVYSDASAAFHAIDRVRDSLRLHDCFHFLSCFGFSHISGGMWPLARHP